MNILTRIGRDGEIMCWPAVLQRQQGGHCKVQIVILGLSITSSWGNGHAVTYRSLVRGLSERGHDVLFLERNKPWYAENRDLPNPPFGKTQLYESVKELKDKYRDDIRRADLVIVGS